MKNNSPALTITVTVTTFLKFPMASPTFFIVIWSSQWKNINRLETVTVLAVLKNGDVRHACYKSIWWHCHLPPFHAFVATTVTQTHPNGFLSIGVYIIQIIRVKSAKCFDRKKTLLNAAFFIVLMPRFIVINNLLYVIYQRL